MQKVKRLVKRFIPNNYNLSIKLNRIARSFEGTVSITGLAISKENEIIFHCKDLTIISVKVDNKKTDYSCAKNDELIIKHQTVDNKKNKIDIKFCGKITDSMHGLYPCYYKHNSIKKELLATQFESHHAREVFPCIDEPEAKATFNLTLITEKNVIVLGNMPIKKQIEDDCYLKTKFQKTPKMSSYLLAWVVGELHKKTAHTKNGIEVNVWATPAQPASNLDFALDIATRTTDFYDEYFDTPYPLIKCDHVALPDFSSGAMENWGLITYREVLLLADPKTTSISNKQFIAMVISHELSHQWFGNLVTMKWWNDLWLNESFASLIEYTAIDSIEPSWNVWLDFASNEASYALRRDSLEGIQSVKTDVNHPDEINTLFDSAIVYHKGARLLQMLEHFIGEKVFQAGLKKYFKKFAYQNTSADDLWSVFNEITEKNVSALMNPWMIQPGFPVVDISQKKNKIILSQRKMSNDPNNKNDSIWPIPLNSNCPDMPELLETKSLEVTINHESPLKLNVGNRVHFITNYDDILLEKIIKQIESGEISPIDRLQLLNEQILLARAGIISNHKLIPLLLAFKNEDNESTWGIIGSAIYELQKFVENDKKAELKLKEITRSLVDKQFKRLGWEVKLDESSKDTKLRAIIIGLVLYSQDKDAIDYSINQFNTKPIEDLDPEIRGLILSAVVKNSDDEIFIDDLLNIYITTDSAELQQDLCNGITSTKNNKIACKLLDNLKDTSVIRIQDTSRWFVYLIRNKHTRVQTWQWLRDNWDFIEKTFGGDKSYDEYPRYAASALKTRYQLEEYVDFFSPLIKVPSLSRIITVGTNEIKNYVELIERDSITVIETLNNL